MRPLWALAFALAPVTGAGAFQLEWPVDCTLGDTCFIQQYVDRDPGDGAQDHTCGPLSYDGHRGTDIRLPRLVDLRPAAPEVLAAAPGTVIAIRDEMPDVALGSAGGPTDQDIAGRECGNGVVLDHGDGWETRYCHMARFSIAVKPGDTVAVGTVLGRVGLSGATTFAHLHFGVERNDETVDPFAPDPDAACNPSAPTDTLWRDPPPYQPGAILSVGVADRVPEQIEIDRALLGDSQRSRREDALVLWVLAFGAQRDDAFQFILTGPGGETVLERTALIEKTMAQVVRAYGRRTPPDGWPAGRYQAEIKFRRDGGTLDSKRFDVILTDP